MKVLKKLHQLPEFGLALLPHRVALWEVRRVDVVTHPSQHGLKEDVEKVMR